MSSTTVQNFKSIAQFLTPKWSVVVFEIIPIYDLIFSNAIFATSGGRTQKQMTPLDSGAKAGQDRYLFVHIYQFQKFDLFDLTLTSPSLKNFLKGPQTTKLT